MQVAAGLLLAARLLCQGGRFNAAREPARHAVVLAGVCWELRAMALLALPRLASFVQSYRISRCLVLLRARPATRALRALTGRSRGCWSSGSSDAPDVEDVEAID